MKNKKINYSNTKHRRNKRNNKYTYKNEKNKYYRMPVMFKADKNGGHPHLIYKDTEDGSYISIGLTHNYQRGIYSSTYQMSRNPLEEPSYIKDYAVKDKKGAYRADKKCKYAYLSESDYKKVRKSVRNYYRNKK